jgi:hypothetical protein
MRYSILILLSFLLLGLSCKKPKRGYWQITFNGSSSMILYSKSGNTFSGSEPASHGGYSCTIEISDTKIIKGAYDGYSEFSGIHWEGHYTDFEGTCDRKQGAGTYKYRATTNSYYPYTHDSTITGTGTFEIKWMYRKEPKK